MGHSKALRDPLDWGRSTNKPKEPLYKTQILPSQLMCKDRKGKRGRNAAAGIVENNVGRKKKERGR